MSVTSARCAISLVVLILSGAFLSQRHDLARAVVGHVGIHGMLQLEVEGSRWTFK
jgi:hypothetical protein